MATKAELDAIRSAIANLTTQVGAVANSISQAAQAVQTAHDAEDDAALEEAVKNINAQADALKGLAAPAQQAVDAATVTPGT